MLLPGGLLRAGERRRDAALRRVDGRVELAVAELGADLRLPARVSAVLAVALEHVGGLPPTPELLGELCVADRQFLMHRLAERLGMGEPWLSVDCVACGERFDFQVHLAELPVREAPAGFPRATVDTSAGPVAVRVPTGADQDAVAAIEDAGAAERALLARCAEPGPGGAPPLSELTADDVARIEAVLEDLSPAVVTRLAARCPACGCDLAVELNPYLTLGATSERLLDEVHALAQAYHWGEAEILSLPLDRRRRYLARIDRARGMVQ